MVFLHIVSDFELVEMDSDDTSRKLSEVAWLDRWSQLISFTPHISKVPPSACNITTPLVLSGWCHFLRSHPDQQLVKLFLKGILEGCKLGYNYQQSHLKAARRNLMGAITHPDVVDNYLQIEITAGRVVGPFSVKSLPEVHISRFGVIPKNHNPDKWRLIVDLSHPKGHSVNDGIPKDLCSRESHFGIRLWNSPGQNRHQECI